MPAPRGRPAAPVAFSISAAAISPIEATTTGIEVTRNQPLVLSWVPATRSLESMIEVLLVLNRYGSDPRGQVVCTTPDTGSFEIPATVVNELIDLGVAGFPKVVISRKARGSAEIGPGRVDLVMVSEVLGLVSVTGYASCNVNEDCPAGQNCSFDYLCR